MKETDYGVWVSGITYIHTLGLGGVNGKDGGKDAFKKKWKDVHS